MEEKDMDMKGQNNIWSIVVLVFGSTLDGGEEFKGIGFAISERFIVTTGPFLYKEAIGQKYNIKYFFDSSTLSVFTELVRVSSAEHSVAQKYGLLELKRSTVRHKTIVESRFQVKEAESNELWRAITFDKDEKNPHELKKQLINGNVVYSRLLFSGISKGEDVPSELFIELKETTQGSSQYYRGAPVVIGDAVVGILSERIQDKSSYYALPILRVFELLSIDPEKRVPLPPSQNEVKSTVESPPDVELMRELDEPKIGDDVKKGSVSFSPGFSTDSAVNRDDQLGITDDVENLCRVIAAKDVKPPLSIGLFGDWGMGKSFFMDHMERYIQDLAEGTRNLKFGSSMFYGHIAQIRFNAWHYVDSNLWASVATHIFESLKKYLEESDKQPEKPVEKLFKLLEKSNKELQDIQSRKGLLEKNIELIKEKINEKEKEIDEKNDLLVDIQTVAFAKVKTIFAAAETELKAACNDIGVKTTLKNLDEVYDQIRKFHAFGAKVKQTIKNHKVKTFISTLAIMAAVPLGSWVFSLLEENLALLGRIATPTAASILSGVTWLRKGLNNVKNGLNKLETARDDIKKRQLEATNDLHSRLKILESERAELEREKGGAERRQSEITTQINDIQSGRYLTRFIDERIRSGDYQKHLGLISMIHNDFWQLSIQMEQLTELKKENPDLDVTRENRPNIERIVLYIDDLDRCPEERVVEVLQAVHLLLALPLFVVVVAVDPRWLIHSLRQKYKTLNAGQNKSNSSSPDPALWVSTPMNYLEKIFQVPFSLPEMSVEGYEKLVESLIPVAKPGEEQESEKQEAGKDAPENTNANSAEIPTPTSVKTMGSQTPNQGSEIENNGAKLNFNSKDTKSDDIERQGKPDMELNPAALKLEPWEVESMKKLKSMIRSPRTAKSFTNLYRLIRAGVDSDKITRFKGTREKGGYYEAVLILLAVTVGYPREAPVFFEHLRRNEGNKKKMKTFLEYLKGYTPKGTGSRELEGPKGDLGTVPEELCDNLWVIVTDKRKMKIDDNLKVFQDWAPHVTRFSFRSGKVGGISLDEELDALPTEKT